MRIINDDTPEWGGIASMISLQGVGVWLWLLEEEEVKLYSKLITWAVRFDYPTDPIIPHVRSSFEAKGPPVRGGVKVEMILLKWRHSKHCFIRSFVL